MEHTKELFNNSINYCDSPEKALEGVDFCFILTNLKEFRNPELYKNVFVIDAVRAVDLKENYEGICW